MAQFQVPQFIETEAKIVGPLTLKQFIYLAVAGLLLFFLFFTLRLEIWIFIAIFIGAFAAALAFLKYNGRPFEVLVINAALYIWKPKLYLWQRPDVKAQMPQVPKIPQIASTPGSKVKNLWLNLMTQKPPVTTPPPPTAQAPIIHPVKQGEESKSGLQTLRNILERKKGNK